MVETKGEVVERKQAPPPTAYDYGEDAGSGFQNQTSDDISLPFIDILQPSSAEVSVEGTGARPGMLINRVTGELWEGAKGVLLIPAITEHCYTEWKPKNGPNGETLPGGFVGRHELTEPIVQQAREQNPFGAFKMASGNELQESFYVFARQLEEPEGGAKSMAELASMPSAPVGMPFLSTRIKAYKSWMYVARAIQVLTARGRQNPPLYAHVYRVTTKRVEKNQNRWFIPVVTFAFGDAELSRLGPQDHLYQEAKSIVVAYNAGTVKSDYKAVRPEAEGATGAAAGGKAPF